MYKKLLLRLEQTLLAKTCLLCHKPAQQTYDLCSACEQDLPGLKNACACCAHPLPANSPADQLCGVCLRDPPPFNKILALYNYEEPIIHLISAFKFYKNLAVGRVFSELMLNRFAKTYLQKPDCLIPIPLHPQRLRERGFNQALELAKPLAKQLQIPLKSSACIRHKFTATQAHSPAAAREHNVKHAFSLTENVQGQHIVLIDDVVTTGHTARACSAVLMQQGAAKVDIWCCARTQLN